MLIAPIQFGSNQLEQFGVLTPSLLCWQVGSSLWQWRDRTHSLPCHHSSRAKPCAVSVRSGQCSSSVRPGSGWLSRKRETVKLLPPSAQQDEQGVAWRKPVPVRGWYLTFWAVHRFTVVHCRGSMSASLGMPVFLPHNSSCSLSLKGAPGGRREFFKSLPRPIETSLGFKRYDGHALPCCLSLEPAVEPEPAGLVCQGAEDTKKCKYLGKPPNTDMYITELIGLLNKYPWTLTRPVLEPNIMKLYFLFSWTAQVGREMDSSTYKRWQVLEKGKEAWRVVEAQTTHRSRRVVKKNFLG